VSPCRLLGIVGGGVAAHHVRAGVAQEILDFQLASVLLDRPGGERVAEAVGVDLGDTGVPRLHPYLERRAKALPSQVSPAPAGRVRRH
jgi:hypothetical protein